MNAVVRQRDLFTRRWRKLAEPAKEVTGLHIHPPDLQELVRRFGGYHLIPPAAWAEHDRAVEEYRTLMRNGELNK
jgi:hypothetical protein